MEVCELAMESCFNAARHGATCQAIVTTGLGTRDTAIRMVID